MTQPMDICRNYYIYCPGVEHCLGNYCRLRRSAMYEGQFSAVHYYSLGPYLPNFTETGPKVSPPSQAKENPYINTFLRYTILFTNHREKNKNKRNKKSDTETMGHTLTNYTKDSFHVQLRGI